MACWAVGVDGSVGWGARGFGVIEGCREFVRVVGYRGSIPCGDIWMDW